MYNGPAKEDRRPGGRVGPRVFCALLGAAVTACAAAPAGAQYGWRWGVDPARYKKMNTFARAQYNKASGLFEKRQYKVAAKEFEKFRVQFPDSAITSHVLFMQGRSQHYCKDRHHAVKTYTEVLDYFGDEIDDAAPAIYFLARAHLDNGDIRKALEVMKQMVEDERYRNHRLAAGALRMLADNHWKNAQYAAAIHYWKQTVLDFSRTNPHEAGRARNRVTAWYLNARNYSGYENWMIDPKRRDDAAYRKGIVQHAMGVQGSIEGYPLKRGERNGRKRRFDDRLAFYEYFRTSKQWWVKTKDMWGWWVALWDWSQGVGKKKEVERAIGEIVKIIKATKDDTRRDGRWVWLIGRMMTRRQLQEVRVIISYLTDRLLAEWKIYELLAFQGKHLEVDKQLQKIEKLGHGTKWESMALRARAMLYKDALGWYGKAIKLFHEIDDPPWTLWMISQSYWSWKKPKQAITMLHTIENMFPPQAPSASFTRASYYDALGEGTMAIKECRRILKMYRRTQESSSAHQMLEKYKKKTGGGVMDEDGL